MLRAADMHARIHESYNLPYHPAPGSIMEKAVKLWRKKQARRQRALEKKLQREAQRIRRMEAAEAAATGRSGKKAAAAPPPQDEESGSDGEGIDDDDLIASTAGVEQQQQQQGQQQSGGGPFQPPSVLGSMSLGLSRAAISLQRAFHQAAVRAPPRRALTRPQRFAAQ
jgi:hypothetical protein